MKQVMYVVQVGVGDDSNFEESIKFTTKDKGKAEKWVNKFNRIIQDNIQRMDDFRDKYEDFHLPPFCYKVIRSYPVADFEEVGYRP